MSNWRQAWEETAGSEPEPNNSFWTHITDQCERVCVRARVCVCVWERERERERERESNEIKPIVVVVREKNQISLWRKNTGFYCICGLVDKRNTSDGIVTLYLSLGN